MTLKPIRMVPLSETRVGCDDVAQPEERVYLVTLTYRVRARSHEDARETYRDRGVLVGDEVEEA